jgi:hypothetical protein
MTGRYQSDIPSIGVFFSNGLQQKRELNMQGKDFLCS